MVMTECRALQSTIESNLENTIEVALNDHFGTDRK